jgi:hypothetical protein
MVNVGKIKHLISVVPASGNIVRHDTYSQRFFTFGFASDRYLVKDSELLR